jgi:hypothetical protein
MNNFLVSHKKGVKTSGMILRPNRDSERTGPDWSGGTSSEVTLREFDEARVIGRDGEVWKSVVDEGG